MQVVWKGPGSDFSSQIKNGTAFGVSYLMPTRGDLDVLYSNVPSTQVVYPNQALVAYSAPIGQEVWMLVDSTRQVESVTVGNTMITNSSSYASLVNAAYAASGWFAQKDGIMLIRFQSAGQGVVRVLLTPPPPPNQFLAEVAWVAPLVIIVAMAGVDVAIWATFIRRRAQKERRDGPQA
jgi:hypothetical protein